MSPARLVLPLFASLRFNLKSFVHKIGLAYDIQHRKNTIQDIDLLSAGSCSQSEITAVRQSDCRHLNWKHPHTLACIHTAQEKCTLTFSLCCILRNLFI